VTDCDDEVYELHGREDDEDVVELVLLVKLEAMWLRCR
jgi:hypothetical protein